MFEPDSSYKEKAFNLLAIALLLLCAGYFLLRANLLSPDGVGYYAYLRSLVVDHDLSFYNEYQLFLVNKMHWFRTPTGYLGNSYPVGTAILWSPFFLFAYLWVKLFSFFPFFKLPPPEVLYIVAINFGTMVYGILTLWLCYRICRTYFKTIPSAAATMSILLGSPFLYYMIHEGSMSHICSAFTAALFFYCWLLTREHRTEVQWFFLGALAGIMVLVRTAAAPFALIPVAYMLHQWAAGKIPLRRTEVLKKSFFYSMGAGMALLPQIVLSKIFYGHFIYSPQTFFLDNKFYPAIFFSAHAGIFFWTPLWLLAITGLIFFWKRDRFSAVAAASCVIYEIAIKGFRYGGLETVSFGSRGILDCTVFFAIGLGALLSAQWKKVSLLTALACMVWCLLLFFQVQYLNLNLQEYAMPSQLFSNQIAVLKHFPDALWSYCAKEKVADRFETFKWSILIPNILSGTFFLFLFKMWIPKLVNITKKSALLIIGVPFIALSLLLAYGHMSGNFKKNLPGDMGKLPDFETWPKQHVALTALSHMSRYDVAQGLWTDAVFDLKRAIALYDFPEAHLLLADILIKNGAIDSAIEEVKRAIDLNPQNAEAHHNLGVLFRVKKDYRRAVDSFGGALQIKPDFYMACFLMAKSYEDLKEPGKAREFYIKAAKLEKK